MVWPEASAALAAQEQLFRTLANSIPQLAWMAEDQGSTFWYNQRWYDFSGTSFADMQAGKWRDLYTSSVQPIALLSRSIANSCGDCSKV